MQQWIRMHNRMLFPALTFLLFLLQGLPVSDWPLPFRLPALAFLGLWFNSFFWVIYGWVNAIGFVHFAFALLGFASWVACLFLGTWFDRLAGTAPLGTLAGFLVGIVMIAVVDTIRRRRAAQS